MQVKPRTRPGRPLRCALRWRTRDTRGQSVAQRMSPPTIIGAGDTVPFTFDGNLKTHIPPEALARVNDGTLDLRVTGRLAYLDIFEKAHEIDFAGDVDAQAILGLLSNLGRGMSRDATNALTWLRLAANGGSAIGQLWLSIALENGAERRSTLPRPSGGVGLLGKTGSLPHRVVLNWRQH
jgi:hypothetical protein